MSSQSRTPEQILTMLAATPSRMAALTFGLTPTQLCAAPSPSEWSANAVLAHMRSCADVWGNCIATMLDQDAPTIRAVNPTTWINSTDYREQPFQPSLHAFTTQRAELLTVLEAIAPASWLRAATVTGAGKPLERTVRFYAQWLANHERPHIKQIAHIVHTLPK